jgi:hypothetical protein
VAWAFSSCGAWASHLPCKFIYIVNQLYFNKINHKNILASKCRNITQVSASKQNHLILHRSWIYQRRGSQTLSLEKHNPF